MDSSVRLPAVRPVDDELHPLPPRHAANPPSLRPHLQEPRVLGDLGKWQAGAQSGNKVVVAFESQVAARLMIRAANLAVAWASEQAGGRRWLVRASEAETSRPSFLKKMEGRWLPSRQGETLQGPGLNDKAFYAA